MKWIQNIMVATPSPLCGTPPIRGENLLPVRGAAEGWGVVKKNHPNLILNYSNANLSNWRQ